MDVEIKSADLWSMGCIDTGGGGGVGRESLFMGRLGQCGAWTSVSEDEYASTGSVGVAARCLDGWYSGKNWHRLICLFAGAGM